jgi:hypothetical protein
MILFRQRQKWCHKNKKLDIFTMLNYIKHEYNLGIEDIVHSIEKVVGIECGVVNSITSNHNYYN